MRDLLKVMLSMTTILPAASLLRLAIDKYRLSSQQAAKLIWNKVSRDLPIAMSRGTGWKT